MAACAASTGDRSATSASSEPPIGATSSPVITADETDSPMPERPNGLWDQIYRRNQTVAKAGSGMYRTPVRAMPQMRYIIDGEEISIADAYVAGQVVAVEPGRSFRWSYEDEWGDGPATMHELDFDAQDAQISTIHLVVRIDRAIVDPDASQGVHQDLAAGSTVTMGVALATTQLDLASIQSELVDQQTHLAALVYDWEFFDYADNVWSVGNDGIQLGRIRDDVVEFPALRYEGGLEELEGGSYIRAEGPDGPKIFTVPVEILEAPQTGEPEAFTSDPLTGQSSPVS